MEIFNFSAGPACLPKDVLAKIKEDLYDWQDGMSILELGHRLPGVMAMFAKTEQDLRDLLSIPDEFAVLFMHGGARTQFAAAAMNLYKNETEVDYLVSGFWSKLAYQEAQKYTQANLLEFDVNHTPSLSNKAKYCYVCDNETIDGIELNQAEDYLGLDNKLLIADMTSNLLTKPIDFSKYAAIFASTQKNLGIAGLTVVIVKQALLNKNNAFEYTPMTLDYSVCLENKSMYNTPPVFCWYVLGLILEWSKSQGGLGSLAKKANERSELLYNYIDNSDYYYNDVDLKFRSRLNVPFRIKNNSLEQKFLIEAISAGLMQLNGHRVKPGLRASLYNAMPISGVTRLVEFMQKFAQNN